MTNFLLSELEEGDRFLGLPVHLIRSVIFGGVAGCRLLGSELAKIAEGKTVEGCRCNYTTSVEAHIATTELHVGCVPSY